MADNYLITGYHGVPHVTSENDRGINAGMFGIGRYVLNVGKLFNAEYVGNNTVRMYDGKLLDNGAAAGIPAGEYIEFVIPTASRGMRRHDLIVFQYSKNSSTLIESGSFVVIQGEETSGTPTDPSLRQQDLLVSGANFDQMALWRIVVEDTTINTPVKLYKAISHITSDVEDISADFLSFKNTELVEIATVYVYKQGNVVSGYIRPAGNITATDGIDYNVIANINTKYKPLNNGVVTVTCRRKTDSKYSSSDAVVLINREHSEFRLIPLIDMYGLSFSFTYLCE